MYCPGCAAPNSDDAKFCRSCGASLEIIALAMSGKLTPATRADSEKAAISENWQEKHAKARRELSTGAIILAFPIMILLIPMLFLANFFPWLIIWSIFFGWMAVWGTIWSAMGIGGIIESRTLRRHQEMDPARAATAPEAGLLKSTLWSIPASAGLSEPDAARPSVTESTTKNLECDAASKDGE